MDREAGAHGAGGVVLVTDRRAEDGKEAVPGQLRNRSAEALDLLAHEDGDLVEEELRPLRAELLSDRRRAGNVGDEDGDESPLSCGHRHDASLERGQRLSQDDGWPAGRRWVERQPLAGEPGLDPRGERRTARAAHSVLACGLAFREGSLPHPPARVLRLPVDRSQRACHLIALNGSRTRPARRRRSGRRRCRVRRRPRAARGAARVAPQPAARAAPKGRGGASLNRRRTRRSEGRAGSRPRPADLPRGGRAARGHRALRRAVAFRPPRSSRPGSARP